MPSNEEQLLIGCIEKINPSTFESRDLRDEMLSFFTPSTTVNDGFHLSAMGQESSSYLPFLGVLIISCACGQMSIAPTLQSRVPHHRRPMPPSPSNCASPRQ